MTKRTKIIEGKKRYLVSSSTTKAAARNSLLSMKRNGLIRKGRVVKFSKKQAKYEDANYGIYA